MSTYTDFEQRQLDQQPIERQFSTMAGCPECGDQYWDRNYGDKCDCGETLINPKVIALTDAKS